MDGIRNTDEAVPRKLKFFAKDCGVDREFALCAGFSRDRTDEKTEEALILQRASADADDEGVYVEIPPQRFVSYGGVKSAELTRDGFDVVFEPETSRDLNDIGAMEISFSVSATTFEEIKDVLAQIFRGHEDFRITDV